MRPNKKKMASHGRSVAEYTWLHPAVKQMQMLIVGAGPTASVLACSLARKHSKQELNVTVWEKSRGVGGRMVW
jgi:ribulose 1,5-bisphosphate synthetase/thiazole synthase